MESFGTITATINDILKHKFFFISGAPKSGTTWLQKALDAHPHAQCSGEGHFINALLHPFNQAANVYNEQLEKVAAQVYQNETYYAPIDDKDRLYVMRAMIALILSKRPPSPEVIAIGDKTPAHALYMPQLNLLFPQAKFVHIVRDARDVAVSTLKHAERARNKLTDKEVFLRAVAERWVLYNEEAFAFGKKHPDKFHWLRYRDLLDDFEGSIRNILLYLELDAAPEIVAACRQATDFKVLSGGRENGQEDPNSFYRKGIKGDWINHFREEELEPLYDICRPMLHRLGFMSSILTTAVGL